MRILVLFIFLLKMPLHGQDYYSKLIPFHILNVNPIAADIEIYNNEILIPVIYNSEQSSLIRLNLEGKVLNYHDYPLFVSSKDAISIIKDRIYMYGKDRTLSNDLKLITLNEDFKETLLGTYLIDLDISFTSSSTNLNNHIYYTSTSESATESHVETTIRKVDTLGNEIWDIDLGVNDHLTYPNKLIPSLDDNILIATHVNRTNSFGSYSQIFKINQEGNIQWRYDAPEQASDGAVPHTITQLSDSNIVIATVVDRQDSIDFMTNDWHRFATKYIWIDADGKYLKDTLFTSPRKNEINGFYLEEGKGDYFFSIGDWRDPEAVEKYGWIIKMANSGQILWARRYQHPKYYQKDVFHTIIHLEEMDNGDIITVGAVHDSGNPFEIWVMRLNENGCFSDGDCGEEVITAVEDQYNNPEKDITIYPNPVKDQFTISGLEPNQILALNVYDMIGRKVYFEYDNIGNSVQVDDHLKGLFVLTITHINKSIYSKVFLKE